MLEVSASIWASMNSWFTPTVLFLLLNLMIGTIAFTSTFSNQKQQQNQPQKHSDPNHTPIARSPSILHRLKSINFSLSPQVQPKQNPDSDAHFNSQAAHYFFQQTAETQTQTHFTYEQTTEETQTHFDLEPKDSNFDDFSEAHEERVEENEGKSMDEVYSQLKGAHFNRSKSDTQPSSGEIPAKMKKSASLKSAAFGHFEELEMVEARRPATVREGKPAAAYEGVDAKADDFINRFKQQLKLQRLDSINFRGRK